MKTTILTLMLTASTVLCFWQHEQLAAARRDAKFWREMNGMNHSQADDWRQSALANLREGTLHVEALRRIESKLDQLLARPQAPRSVDPFYVIPMPSIPYTNWFQTNYIQTTNGLIYNGVIMTNCVVTPEMLLK